MALARDQHARMICMLFAEIDIDLQIAKSDCRSIVEWRPEENLVPNPSGKLDNGGASSVSSFDAIVRDTEYRQPYFVSKRQSCACHLKSAAKIEQRIGVKVL